MPVRRLWLLVALAFAWVLAFEGQAHARTKVEIVSVVWAKPTESAQRVKAVERSVRRHAAAAMKHLKFGEAGKARVTITIRDLQVIEDGDVLRMSCTLVGKLEGGGSARSKISFGGKLDERKKLERQVIAAAAEGLMVRLAEMAKQRERDAKRAKPAS